MEGLGLDNMLSAESVEKLFGEDAGTVESAEAPEPTKEDEVSGEVDNKESEKEDRVGSQEQIAGFVSFGQHPAMRHLFPFHPGESAHKAGSGRSFLHECSSFLSPAAG